MSNEDNHFAGLKKYLQDLVLFDQLAGGVMLGQVAKVELLLDADYVSMFEVRQWLVIADVLLFDGWEPHGNC